jgi:ribosomal protein L28
MGGVVHVCDLTGNPTAVRAYAIGEDQAEGSTKRRFFAGLRTERISSPLEAVRAAIVAEHKTKR